MRVQPHSFGYWLRRRRKALDLTQEALGERVSCSGFTIRKIEADERRPSRPLAKRLAVALAIPEAELRAFLEAARAERAVDRLPTDERPLSSPAAAVAAVTGADPAEREATPFVGRSHEHGVLAALLERLAQGAGQVVLIEGEPGIGKSRLMRELARRAQALGIATLASPCYEIERAMPYQPVIELATRAIDRASPGALKGIPAVLLAELAALVPGMEERFPGLPRLSADFPEARQARLSRAVAQLLEAFRGERPLLLMVDDIQWADEASAQVLHYLAREAGQRPLLMACAYRDEDLRGDARVSRLVASLRRVADTRVLTLSRLEPEDTRSLLGSVGGKEAPALAERLHRETEGNPFFLVSILQSLQDGEIAPGDRELLPSGLRAAVRARLASLAPEALRTLEAAAVLGRRFDFDTLLAVTGKPEEQLLVELEVLVKRRLLLEEADGSAYDFSHDKLREVVYRDIVGARRRVLHRSVAEALDRAGDAPAHERDARLAEHYERAGDWARALEHLVLAGERSRQLFAMRDALHWLDRAVALAQSHPEAADAARRVALHDHRGAARAQAGQTEGAVEDFRIVIEAARAAGDREKARDALIQLGMAYRRADLYEDATSCLTEALGESRALGDERRVADTLYHLGTVAWSTGLNHRAIALHQEAVSICGRAGFADLVAVQAWHGRGEAHFANAEPAAAIACYARSLELARRIGDRSYESENLMMIGHAGLGSRGSGDYDGAISNLEAALEIARAADLQWHLGPTLLGLDHARASTGRYGEAWSGMQQTLAWLAGLGQARYQVIACDYIAQLLLDLRMDDAADEALERGLALGRRSGSLYWAAGLVAQQAVAHARLGLGDRSGEVRSALERSRQCSERYHLPRCLEALAEIGIAGGDAEAALAAADELLALAQANGLREQEACARYWRGRAMFALGRVAAAREALEASAGIAAAVGRIRVEMDAQAALAQVRDAGGEGEAAAAHHARARALAARISGSLGASGLEVRFTA